MENIKKELNTPRWNLDSIYNSIESTSYKNDVDKLLKSIDKIDELIKETQNDSNIDFAKWLSEYILFIDDVLALRTSLSAYAYLIYSVDTTNKKYLDNLSRIDEINMQLETRNIQFRSILKKHSNELPNFFKSYPQFSEYKFVLDESLEYLSHQMSEAEENLALDLQRTGGDSWDRLHEQIISNLKDEQTGKTFNELRNDAYSPDANIRKTSYEKEISLLKANRIAFAASLNNLKGETVTLNKRRNWESAIDRALFSSRMSKKTLDALIGAIEDSLPMWRSYLQFKAQNLYGKTSDVSLSFYDLFAPVNTKSNSEDNDSILNRVWTFDEAREYIIERYSSFSDDMGMFAKKAFDNTWIDAEVREGKVGGAYCEDFPFQKESRILSNYTGAFSDIITLAHELGHAYHHHCIANNKFMLSSYPMTLAETASTFAETIVKQDIMSKASSSEKASLIELDLQDVCQVLVDILCRFYFERSVFEKRVQGELTADDFCKLMKDAQEKSYGNGLNENRHEYMWAVKSHYYSTSLDFYNFPYAFGQLFGAALYTRYKKEGSEFANIYKSLLADTGKMSCEKLCLNAGFDITTKDFWKTGIDLYAKEFEELKSSIK